MGPHMLRVQQSVSSAAKKSGCPVDGCKMEYLLLVSKPVNASKSSTFCLTMSLSRVVKTSRFEGGFEMLMVDSGNCSVGHG